jgi:hypothetical protein
MYLNKPRVCYKLDDVLCVTGWVMMWYSFSRNVMVLAIWYTPSTIY